MTVTQIQKNFIRRSNLSDAWIKQAEGKTIYDENQRVTIAEQRQCGLLSNVSAILVIWST